MRKSCAEVIHPLAQVCSKESRWNVLSPCLIQLLQDQSRWVKTAALRVLGYFISTFARTIDDNEQQIQSNDKTNEDLDKLCQNLQETIQISENDKFNDFQYWREPILTNLDFNEEIECLFNLFFSIEIHLIVLVSTRTNRKESLLEISKTFDRDNVNVMIKERKKI